MKKLKLLLSAALLAAGYLVPAQLNVSGSTDFGRIFDLTYDTRTADKIYAVTLGNHIVTSNDNGATWQLYWSLPRTQGTGISQLKMSAAGDALTFVIAGEQAAVAILNLGSSTITKRYVMPNVDDAPQVISYSFYAQNSDILVVDTNWQVGFENFGKSFYTDNGGNSWKEIYSTEDSDKVFINNIAIDPVDPSRLFLLRGLGSLGVDGGLLISEDAGTTFTEQLSGSPLKPIAFNPANPTEIYMGTGIGYFETEEKLFRSTDGGATWSTIQIDWNMTGATNHLITIGFNPLNDDIYVLEEDEVAISKDGGATWTKTQYEPDNLTDYYYGMSLSFNPFNENQMVIGQNFSSVISSDGGQTFEIIKTPFFASTGQISMYENAGKKHLYYGVQYGYVHRDLATQTETARDIKPLNAFGSFYPAMIYADRQQEGRIYKYTTSFMGSSLRVSSDHGGTYNELASTNTESILDLTNDPANPNQIWVSYSDFGAAYVQKINFSDVGAPGVTQINLPTSAVVARMLHTGSSSDDLMILAGNSLYQTGDGGTSWTEITTGLSAVTAGGQLFDIAQNPFQSNELALATSVGIFASEDGGQTWNQKTAGIVRKIEYSDTANGKLIAANYTSDSSVFALYYSGDNAATWTAVDSGALWNVQSTSVHTDFSGNNATVYIASSDLGLVTYDLHFGGLGVDAAPKSALKVYPNPTTGNLYIGSEIQSAVLYDLLGRKLFETRTSHMDISAINPGMYMLMIRTKDNQEVTRKIIKK